MSFGSMRSKDSIDISVTFDEAGPPSRNSKSSAAAFIPKSGHFKRAKVDTDLLAQGVQPAMATAEDRKSGESGGFRFQIEPPWHEKERAPLVLEASHEAQANNWITDIMNQLLLQPLTAKDGAVKEGEVYTTNSSEKKKKKQYAKSQVALFPSKLCMWKIGCGLTDMDEEEKDNYYWDVNLSAAVTIKVLNCNPLTPNMFPLQLSAGVIVTKNGVDEYSWVTETLCFPSLVLRGSWLESISYVIQKYVCATAYSLGTRLSNIFVATHQTQIQGRSLAGTDAPGLILAGQARRLGQDQLLRLPPPRCGRGIQVFRSGRPQVLAPGRQCWVEASLTHANDQRRS